MYNIIQGDTFESISRKVYGSEVNAALIREGNPGLTEPLTPGITIAIPDDPDTVPENISVQGINNENSVTILIENELFQFWESVRIFKSFDALSTIEFTAPHEADSEIFREIFKPFSYKSIRILIGGILDFTGTIINIMPNTTSNRKSINVGAYAKPGVLNDCPPFASQYPIEYRNQTLRDITPDLCKPFGIAAVFNDDPGPVFDTVACSPEQPVLSFLTGLAQQRGLYITDDSEGRLVFDRPVIMGATVANITQNAPVSSISPNFNTQEYYSHVTGIEPVQMYSDGSKYTVRNERLTALRPFVFTVKDAAKADVKSAVSAKTGRMFGNAISYNLSVFTWRDSSGSLWKPGTLINVTAPDSMIYREYTFLIRSVEFSKNSRSETAILNLIIPGTFNGIVPERLPWE